MGWYAALRNFQEAPHSHLHNHIFTCLGSSAWAEIKQKQEHDSHMARDPCLFDSIPVEKDHVDLWKEHNIKILKA